MVKYLGMTQNVHTQLRMEDKGRMKMKRNEPKPLDLEEIRNEWRKTERLHIKRVFHLVAKTKQPATINKSEIEEEKLYLVKQCIKSACEFYLRYKDNPKEFLRDYPEHRHFIIDRFVKNTSERGIKYDIKQYNEWLFKFAFKVGRNDTNIISRQESGLVRHPGREEPYCPFCGEKLWTMRTENGFITGVGLDWLLFCRKCNVVWYEETVYFSLRKIDMKEYGFEVVSCPRNH